MSMNLKDELDEYTRVEMGRKSHQDGNSSQAAYINKVNEKSPIMSKRMLTTKILACDFKFFACFLLENYMYNPFPWEEIQVLYNRCEDSFLPTPVFLPGKSQEQRRLGGYSPWGHKFSQHYCCLASQLPQFSVPWFPHMYKS